MDFSYFNAVLKSTTFPPYDPWYAGGYLNYYYYGFVFVGMLVKLLGIVPSFAYNLILPSLFSMLALGAFSVGCNLSTKKPQEEVIPLMPVTEVDGETAPGSDHAACSQSCATCPIGLAWRPRWG